MARNGTVGERLARVEEWQDNHEAQCNERQIAMGREIRELKNNSADMSREFRGLRNGAWGVILALLAWALTQLYTDLRKPPTPAAVAIASPAPANAPGT